MANFIFDSFKEYMGDNSIDMDGDAFKIALFTDSSLPTKSQYTTYSALNSGKNQVSGAGYTLAGKALSSVVWTRSGATVKFDAANPSWTSATFTARYAVVYSSTGGELVCLIDFGSNKTCSNGTFTITFNAAGIFTIS